MMSGNVLKGLGGTIGAAVMSSGKGFASRTSRIGRGGKSGSSWLFGK